MTLALVVRAATPALGSAANKVALGRHFWHVVEALAFIVVSLGGIMVSELVQRRRQAVPAQLGTPRLVPTDRSSTTLAALRPTGYSSAGPAAATGAGRAVLLPLVGFAYIAAASVHVVVMPKHFEQYELYGVFFAVAATLQAVFGTLTVVRPCRRLLLAGVLGNFSVIVLWVATRTVGVPLGPIGGHPEAIGGLDVLATIFESVVVIGSAGLLLGRTVVQPAPDPRRWARGVWVFPVVAAVSIAVTTVVATPS